jgi:RNA polymerase sigma factor (sigma-70 family)
VSELQERTLSGEELAEVERRLHGRLRAHHLSAQLIDRHLEDSIQKGVVEWLRVESGGEEVRDPKSFVVEAAFRRTIDEIRREARRADGATLDVLLETGARSSSSTEDVVIENLESVRLQAAIDSLPAENRQVLALHYFAEVDQKRAAGALYMSERTFRRRLKETLSILSDRLGVAAPEQGSLKGMEIGLAAWAGLGGGRIVASSGVGAPLQSLLDSVRRLPGRVADRLRGSTTNLIASEAPERVGVIAGGPAGKVIGGCAGAAVVCALSGVVGPGLDLGDQGGGQVQPAPPPAHRKVASHRPIVSHRIKVVPSGPEVPARKEEGVKAAPQEASNSGTPSSTTGPARRGVSSSTSTAKKQKKKKVHQDAKPTEARTSHEEFTRSVAEPESTSSSEVGTETSSVQEAAPVKAAPPPAEPTRSTESSDTTSEKSSANSEFGFGR